MDLLRVAVIDITTLVATCQALASVTQRGDRVLRRRLRRQVTHATVAYIDTLARNKRGGVDDTVLCKCRVAAEQQMPRAIRHQSLLRRVMTCEPGSLEGTVASRQDLWRLAHMVLYLRLGIAKLRESGDAIDTETARALYGRLRRRLRKAMIAYARTILRKKKATERLIMSARAASVAAIGEQGVAQAERLAQIEAEGDPTSVYIRHGLSRPLRDLALDWQPTKSLHGPGVNPDS